MFSWKKLGKVFTPQGVEGRFWLKEFAQAPATLIFEDMEKTIRVSDHTVIPLGGLGCFDEHGIFPMNILRHGNDVYGYTTGWSRRISVSVETAIGLAISRDDGLTFQRVGEGPVLAASLLEPCLVCDGFVNIVGDMFHMWYIFGTGWKKVALDAPPDRTYRIGHAVSGDGVEWIKQEGRQIIADRLGGGREPGASLRDQVCRPVPHVLLLSAVLRFPNEQGQELQHRTRMVGRSYVLDTG